LGVIRYLLADFAIVASATTAELVNRLKGIKSVFIIVISHRLIKWDDHQILITNNN